MKPKSKALLYQIKESSKIPTLNLILAAAENDVKVQISGNTSLTSKKYEFLKQMYHLYDWK